MGKIARASACIAVVGALPMAIGIGLPIDGLVRPKTAPPLLASRRPGGSTGITASTRSTIANANCSVHSIVPLAGRAARRAARGKCGTGSSQPVTTPSPSAVTPQAADAPSAASETTGIHPAPRVTVLNVKPVNPPSFDAKSAYGRPLAPEQTNEMPTASVPPDSTPSPHARSVDRRCRPQLTPLMTR